MAIETEFEQDYAPLSEAYRRATRLASRGLVEETVRFYL